jgi:hypothetical protein
MQRSRAGSPYAEPDSPRQVKAKIAAFDADTCCRFGRAGYRRTAILHRFVTFRFRPFAELRAW